MEFTEKEAEECLVNVCIVQPRYIRCTVQVDNKIESILEAEEDVVLEHIRERLEAYEEDPKRVLITISHAEDIPIWDKIKSDYAGGGG